MPWRRVVIRVDLTYPVLQFSFSREVPEEQQVRDLEESAMLRQNFYGVAAIFQDASFTIDEGDAALTGSGIHESGIVRHESKVFRATLDLPEVHSPDRSFLDGQSVSLVGAIVSNCESVLCQIGRAHV